MVLDDVFKYLLLALIVLMSVTYHQIMKPQFLSFQYLPVHLSLFSYSKILTVPAQQRGS